MRYLIDIVQSMFEGWSRIPHPNKQMPYLSLLKNPRPPELLAAIENCTHDSLRGCVLPDALYFWDGESAIHEQVEAALGYDPDTEIHPRLIIMIDWIDGEYGGTIDDLRLFVDPERLTNDALADPRLLRAIAGLPIRTPHST